MKKGASSVASAALDAGQVPKATDSAARVLTAAAAIPQDLGCCNDPPATSSQLVF